MKTLARFIPVVVLALSAGAAGAQVPGQFTGAEVLPVGNHLFGGYLDVSNQTVGLMAQLRLSFYPGIDFGFQGGPSRVNVVGNSKGTVRLATDVKFGLRGVSASSPVDLAIGAGLGVETGDNLSLFSLGPSLTASRTFGSGQVGGVTPYASATLLFTNIDNNAQSNTDVSLPLRFGAEIVAGPTARIVTELQLRVGDAYRDHSVFLVGVNSPF